MGCELRLAQAAHSAAGRSWVQWCIWTVEIGMPALVGWSERGAVP